MWAIGENIAYMCECEEAYVYMCVTRACVGLNGWRVRLEDLVM